jgi:acyl dehydratase
VSALHWDAAYQGLLTHVGQASKRRLGPVSALQFQRFAVAADDLSIRYFSDERARAEGFPAAVAPPLFLSSVMGWEAGPAEDALRADGLDPGETEALPLAGLRIMGAGQELEFFRPVTDGSEVTEEVTLEDVRLKAGRSGPLLIYRLLRRYYDQDGQELLRCREHFIGR